MEILILSIGIYVVSFVSFIYIFSFINKKIIDNILYHLVIIYYKLLGYKELDIIILDIENFNIFNRIYGRKEGDKVLKYLKKHLIKNFKNNKIFNLVGDKFIVINNKQDEINICNEIKYNIINKQFKNSSKIITIFNTYKEEEIIKEKYYIYLSMLKTKLDLNLINYITDFENLIQHGKKSGIQNISGDYLKKINKDLNIENNNYLITKNMVLDCLKEKNRYEFQFVKQAIVNYEETKTKDFKEYELLIRIYDKEKQILISPSFFLDFIYNSPSLLNLFLTVIFNKVSNICNNYPNILFHFNVSYLEINNNISYFELLKMLNNINNKNIMLEFLESIEIEKINERFNNILSFCKENNIKIAIDDFGVGYSNFSYIAELNIYSLKLDGSLIKNIKDKKTFNLIKTLVLFCKTIEVEVVAEFIENEELLTICHKLGIDKFQGYHIHKYDTIENQ